MFAGLFFTFWRSLQIVTLIPTFGMLAWFVHRYTQANMLTPANVLTLFIVSVLAAAWAIATVLRRKSTRESAIFVSFIDLCFIGAFIAGVYELRAVTQQSCSNISLNDNFYITVGSNGVSGSSPVSADLNKQCAMKKASFAFGIMNCIFFAITAFLLLFMHRRRERDVIVDKRYSKSHSRRRSHDSRRGHSRSGSGHHRSSRDYRSRPYV